VIEFYLFMRLNFAQSWPNRMSATVQSSVFTSLVRPISVHLYMFLKMKMATGLD